MNHEPPRKPPQAQTFAESFEEAIQRVRSSLGKTPRAALHIGIAAAGAVGTLAAANVAGCNTDVVATDATTSSGAGTGGASTSSGTGGASTSSGLGGAGAASSGSTSGSSGTMSSASSSGAMSSSSGGASSSSGGASSSSGGASSSSGGVSSSSSSSSSSASSGEVPDGGVADTTMVRYVSSWADYEQDVYGPIDLFLKVLVKPVPGADLSKKRVAVSLRSYEGFLHNPDDIANRYWGYDLTPEVLVEAAYVTTQADGYEAWQVKLSYPSPNATNGNRSPMFLVQAWYEDGLGNTYYDDNQGERHLAKCEINVVSYECRVLRQNTTDVSISSAGIEGRIDALGPALLDPDDKVVVKWTTDNWVTVNETPMVEVGTISNGIARWRADMTTPGNFPVMKYAIGYKHGTVNGAKTYTLWDDNQGAGYVVVQ